ncbi:hypothetical protein RUND412_004036 [Rhizina undulata]
MSESALLEAEIRSLKLQIQELKATIASSSSASVVVDRTQGSLSSSGESVEAGSSSRSGVIDKDGGSGGEPNGGVQRIGGGSGGKEEEGLGSGGGNGQGAEEALRLEEYRRYGRQMILPEIGFEGQKRLKKSRVLIVGAGGLGSPAAAYIAGAGVGAIGIIDHDTVEHSNLHRQIVHASSRVGVSKVISATTFLRDLNPHVRLIPHAYALTPQNALEIIEKYDLVLDCTDHPSLRYLISDASVLLNKTVVSASALRTEGQLIILNHPPGVGPCYRCIWPRPPPPETVVGCGEGGILGPVVGVMGVLQALEAIKVLSAPPPPPNSVPDTPKTTTMTIFSAYPTPQFRSLRMRGRREKCVSCGRPEDAGEVVTAESIARGLTDYVAFCGGGGAGPGEEEGLGLRGGERVGVDEYREVRERGREHLLVDVRDRVQFGICRLEGSCNIPYSEFQALNHPSPSPSSSSSSSSTSPSPSPLQESLIPESLKTLLNETKTKTKNQDKVEEIPIYVLCRLGNDSQLVARQLRNAGLRNVFDIRGGITNWARKSGGTFPEY